MPETLVLGTPAAAALAERLGATVTDVSADGPTAGRIVVAAWPERLEPGDVDHLEPDAWAARGEEPLVAWLVAMGAASARCADGGVIVAVVDRPPPLDAAGWAPESGIADAVEALARSLARSEGPRGVRVNAVTTSVRVARPPVVDPQPPLARYPGDLDDLAGAVRLLLDDKGAGLTGTVVHADLGRSWR